VIEKKLFRRAEGKLKPEFGILIATLAVQRF
jgi:hypothetical protein